jgi:undecaprenyl diphosphate synthase
MEAPKHIAIILDGNRRWAKQRHIPSSKGHSKGFENILELMEWVKELSIKESTLYCFSTENFNRRKEEVDYLFNLMRKKIKGLDKPDSKIHKNKIKVSFIGKLSMFPEDLQQEMKILMEHTAHYDDYILNLAMAYGSKDEIVQALKKVVENGKDINEEAINEGLYLSSDVDLLIRPGGEKRLSNFLLWQSCYAELWFTDKLWPEFSKEDLIDAVEWFNKRDRRFGE